MTEEPMNEPAATVQVAPVEVVQKRTDEPGREIRRETVFGLEDVSCWYGKSKAVGGITLDVYQNLLTAIIGPSGCGKSTFIRCLNRMNDMVQGARTEGRVLYHGQNIYGDGVDPVQVRRHIGMVFQKPNPFPKSIYDNVAWGLRVLG